MIKVLSVFGTRPEAIKMIPIIQELNKYQNVFDSKVCVTGQHREILDQMLNVFEVEVDFDLDIMNKSYNLASISANILSSLTSVFEGFLPDYVLVHGDTSTTFSAALAAFYSKIPVIHIEAGLRTYDLSSPWPEEGNRQLTRVISSLHMVPTIRAKENLLSEKVSEDCIFLTGNTVVDALFLALDKLEKKGNAEKYRDKFKYLESFKRMILITSHRRENQDGGMSNIGFAVKELALRYPDVAFVLPLHPNPKVRDIFIHILESLPNVFLIESVDYLSFVYLMSQSYFIMTDSGGIQEEAPALNKPVLVMRNDTERPEAVEAGTAKLVGSSKNIIVAEAKNLLDDVSAYEKMCLAVNPYGDGTAAKKIVKAIKILEGL